MLFELQEKSPNYAFYAKQLVGLCSIMQNFFSAVGQRMLNKDIPLINNNPIPFLVHNPIPFIINNTSPAGPALFRGRLRAFGKCTNGVAFSKGSPNLASVRLTL